jgi:deoxyribose-phosphate aldolase
MHWDDAIKEYTQQIQAPPSNPLLLERLVRSLDLTSLNPTDTEASMASFFEKAQQPFGKVAAVCVNPAFVRLAATQFAGTGINVATVANFPQGSSSLESVLLEIGSALQSGAQEIDVVFPYLRYLAGERQYAQTFVQACKAACGDVTLKVILETGALLDPAIIADASLDALAAGADFIKTSTGKIDQGATLEAAATMLLVIRHTATQLKRNMGIKISGGIRDVQQAAQYLELADTIMGKAWAKPATFRIGASKLIDEIAKEMAE